MDNSALSSFVIHCDDAVGGNLCDEIFNKDKPRGKSTVSVDTQYQIVFVCLPTFRYKVYQGKTVSSQSFRMMDHTDDKLGHLKMGSPWKSAQGKYIA